MNKRTLPVYQVSGEYAACLEHAFAPGAKTEPGAVSEGSVLVSAQKLGAMGITPLASSQLGVVSEDTAHLCLWVDWGLDEADLFARLRRAQLESQGKLEQASDEEIMESDVMPEVVGYDAFDEPILATPDRGGERYIEGSGNGFIEFGGMLWYVKPSGKGGGDSNRSYYRYWLKNGDVNIFIRRDKHETVANVWLEIGSIPLCRYGGLRNTLDEVYKVFKAEGITVVKEILSRVDMYADYDICGIHDFCERFYNKSRVTRARRIGNYGEVLLNYSSHMVGDDHTGFKIGTDIQLRCYDKRLELAKDPIKWGVFADKYDGIPETLTRVEFQLRRNGLKGVEVKGADGGVEDARIDDVDSYLKARDGLWRYLTCEWFRFTENPVDKENKHHSRAKTWWVWEAIQNAVSSAVESVRRVRRKVQVNPELLDKIGYGCIMEAATQRFGYVESPKALAQYFWDMMKSYGRDYFLESREKHDLRMFMRVGNLLEGS